jgi:chloramphenicol 3-O phosphotransferase
MARVIVLNGTGSVGKSSAAKALQAITAEPFLHVSMDTFLEMMPEQLFGDPEGMVFETIEQDGKPAVVIHTGPVLQRTLAGMRRAVAALAGAGNNLIVDEVMLGGGEAQDYRELLSGFDLRFVGLTAPLEVVEARELARGDRAIGLGRWQYERVHRGVPYDLEIDTASLTPQAVAQRIRDAFGL